MCAFTSTDSRLNLGTPAAGGIDLKLEIHPGYVGLGPAGKSKRSQGSRGLDMDPLPAARGEGNPLGVPRIQCQAPDGQAKTRLECPRKRDHLNLVVHRSDSCTAQRSVLKIVALPHQSQQWTT